MRKRLLLLSSFYRWGHWGLCELHKTTLLRKLLFKSLATFPLSDIPQLAQKRVWVGDAVGEGEGTHWWRRLRVEASEPSHQLRSWWWKWVGLAGVQGTCRTQPVGLSLLLWSLHHRFGTVCLEPFIEGFGSTPTASNEFASLETETFFVA